MKIPKLKTKDLLSVSDLTKKEIIGIFKLAYNLKKDLRKGKVHKILNKKSLAMIFEKSSTRTRVSFETGTTQLGGHALFLSGADIQLGRGETINDTAKVLSRYVDCIMIRTFSHDKVVELSKNSSVPVINGLTDTYHPCQALADFFTIYEIEKDFSKVHFTYIGDGNNVANSLLLAAAILGITISIICPDQYQPSAEAIAKSKEIAAASGANITISADIDSAIRGTNYIYTDVWISMGQENDEARAAKIKALSDYSITLDLLKKCEPGCKVMHCLPAHRGEEISGDVIDSEHSIIFEEAENRMHVQKAIMCALLKNK